MKIKQLLTQAMRHPHSLRIGDALRLAEAFGFRQVRTRGSHRIFSRAGIPQLVNLQEVRGMAKGYQVRQLLKLAEKHNLPIEGSDV